MLPPIEFAKLSGSGNDFICIDNRDGRYDPIVGDRAKAERFARAMCSRGMGIGADGLIFGCDGEVGDLADLAATFLEADGSEAELCGNGTACFAAWVLANQWSRHPKVSILTPAGMVHGQRADGLYIRVCIPLPQDLQRDIELEVKGSLWRCDFVVTGVPHAVIYVDNLEHLDVAHWGPGFRHHPRFAPRGVNANFVQLLGVGKLALRTYEFGVEGETLACGTGSAAAAILGAMRFGWGPEFLHGQRPVEVRSRGGDVLRVYFTLQDDGSVSDVCLETIVRFLYSGTVHEDLARRALNGG